jgi:hypothetical protein
MLQQFQKGVEHINAKLKLQHPREVEQMAAYLSRINKEDQIKYL